MRFSIPLAAVALILLSSIPLASADPGTEVLVDFGNGSYLWSEGSGSTFGEVLDSAADERTAERVRSGGSGACSWRLYAWEDGWRDAGTDLSASCSGPVAFGFYPEGFAPVATPEYRAAWIMLGGSSSASSVSPSHGQREPAMPVEWYNTYSTGYVDSGLVVAGGMLYHTTGGAYGGAGESADAWVYALDRFTGDVVWKHHERKGAGYEVTTPLIVGDYLIVSFTCGDVVCFDRFTGSVKSSIAVGTDPPVDEDGDVLWDGRVFYTGGTTPVYDSGRIYLGTSSGTVMALTLSPEGMLGVAWEHVPPSGTGPDGYTGTRGCFYFHAPTIGEVDGRRVLFIGSYEGYVHALDAGTGEAIWTSRAIDMREDNKAAPGTPGSAASVSLSPDGSVLLVGCTDGALFSLEGYLLALDPRTGEPIQREDGTDWRLDALFTPPVVAEDGFYSYVSPLSSGADSFPGADGGEHGAATAVYKFDWDGRAVWRSQDYQMIKGALTLDADGVLYGMDYSAGAFWPTGGGLTAWDSGTGEEIWRVLLSPYTQDSYSMVQPTVVDGRIYAGNDFGAVYCVSDVAGPGTEEERVQALQTVGFAHWSWYLTALFAAASVAAFVLLYRRTVNA